MTTTAEEDRAEAARLFAEAEAAAAKGDDACAKDCYRRSLRLNDDPEVRAAFLRFLARIGPM
jgi:hypothetical protein